MKKILFVCHGNICRSPMAEYIMKNLLAKSGRKDVLVESAAATEDAVGSPMDPRTTRVLEKNNVPYVQRHARKMTKDDYQNFDTAYDEILMGCKALLEKI